MLKGAGLARVLCITVTQDNVANVPVLHNTITVKYSSPGPLTTMLQATGLHMYLPL